MRRKALLVLALLLMAMLTAGVVWKWAFKRSDTSVRSKEAVIRLEASVLSSAYTNDEATANAKYLGKILEVSGIVNAVHTDAISVSVYLKTPGDLSGVMCTFNPSELDANRLKTGDSITIKGICDGFLMDVMLNKCSLAP